MATRATGKKNRERTFVISNESDIAIGRERFWTEVPTKLYYLAWLSRRALAPVVDCGEANKPGLAPNSSLTQQSPESQKGRDNPEDQEVHVIKSVETIDKKVRREKV